ncbi:MAG: flagellar hook protein FlgE [Vallitaleaceae bacterium]|jgi:flagellar hook protein FlgE|nr:flagellar hook protein FlgE [Vallitaleaceae bacterium]
MMRSMYSGVSGLRIHQTKMDVIGNNIANVNTVGFKSSRTVFSEVFSQTIQGSSGANENSGGTNPMQIGLGASISSIDVDMTEGAAQRTDNPLDLKIEGDGFFVVSDVTGNKFTRAGAFRIDEAGNLVTPDGKNLMGWTPNEVSGEIEKTKVKALQVLNASNAYVEPSQTEKMVIQGNINKNDPQLAVLPGSPFSVSFFDSLGYKYTAQFYIQETATAYEFQFTLPANSITDQDGNTIINDAQNVTVPFDTASGKVTVPPVFELTGLANSATPALTFSEFSDPIEVDVSGLTLFNGNTTVEGVSGDVNGLGAGNEAGSISGFEIGGDGRILGRYTNGETKLLAQIVVATFQNPAGLQKIGANLFEVTNNSGDFDGIGEDITSSGGAFNAGVLEMSNVDLSREFTEMITTQRGFQANSRIITSSDEMLQELVNLKR